MPVANNNKVMCFIKGWIHFFLQEKKQEVDLILSDINLINEPGKDPESYNVLL